MASSTDSNMTNDQSVSSHAFSAMPVEPASDIDDNMSQTSNFLRHSANTIGATIGAMVGLASQEPHAVRGAMLAGSSDASMKDVGKRWNPGTPNVDRFRPYPEPPANPATLESSNQPGTNRLPALTFGTGGIQNNAQNQHYELSPEVQEWINRAIQAEEKHWSSHQSGSSHEWLSARSRQGLPTNLRLR